MESNHFEFVNAGSDVGMTMLNAVMSDFSYAKHAHEELALGVTMDGVQEFACKGQFFRSHPGNIIAFNPGDVHNGHPGTSDALKYTMLYFDTTEFYPLLWSAATSDAKEFRLAQPHFDDAVLRALILNMSRLVTEGRHLAVEYDHCLYAIAKRLAQRLGISSVDAWVRDKDALLLRAREYIHDNITEDISIDVLSGVASLSKYHFIRLFRNQFGLTPHQYILNLKINKVRISLESGTAVSDVAQDFGFFDVSHLNRSFKRFYGITPKQYQQQIKP
ncbi:AraC family transcriptional regulator [Pseudodesulfovibrio sp. JC047]|nr:AraC family transcriptional regulator [Pseudodesulfovibrio sp. JC047]